MTARRRHPRSQSLAEPLYRSGEVDRIFRNNFGANARQLLRALYWINGLPE
jgi:hypothetical protein